MKSQLIVGGIVAAVANEIAAKYRQVKMAEDIIPSWGNVVSPLEWWTKDIQLKRVNDYWFWLELRDVLYYTGLLQVSKEDKNTKAIIDGYYNKAKECLNKHDMNRKYDKIQFATVMVEVKECVYKTDPEPVFEVPKTETIPPNTDVPPTNEYYKDVSKAESTQAPVVETTQPPATVPATEYSYTVAPEATQYDKYMETQPVVTESPQLISPYQPETVVSESPQLISPYQPEPVLTESPQVTAYQPEPVPADETNHFTTEPPVEVPPQNFYNPDSWQPEPPKDLPHNDETYVPDYNIDKDYFTTQPPVEEPPQNNFYNPDSWQPEPPKDVSHNDYQEQTSTGETGNNENLPTEEPTGLPAYNPTTGESENPATESPEEPTIAPIPDFLLPHQIDEPAPNDEHIDVVVPNNVISPAVYPLSPASPIVPPFWALDVDGDGVVTPDEWKDYVHRLYVIATDRATEGDDPKAVDLLHASIDFHYFVFSQCLNNKIKSFPSKVYPTDFDTVHDAVEKGCPVKFRYWINSSPPPFEWVAKYEPTVTGAEIQAFVDKYVAKAKNSILAGHLKVGRDEIVLLQRIIGCASSALSNVADVAVDRNTYYQLVEGIEKCAS